MPAAILARLVLLEARRGGLPWLAAGSIAVGISLAAFLSQVALTESRTLQVSLLAALLRACAVFLIAAHVAASTAREINDRGLEFMLSLPLARRTHYLGRLAGFAVAGFALAAVFSLPLFAWSPASAVAAWGLSLAFETALVAAAALFFAMTLGQVVPAIATTAGLYLLARSVDAIRAIAGGPLAEPSLPSQLARLAVDGVSLLLPPLDSVTRTEWLLYGAPGGAQYLAALGALAAYGLLLVAAGLFDFYRRST
jgi:ABC-type Na+ efflux pump permease subunit